MVSPVAYTTSMHPTGWKVVSAKHPQDYKRYRNYRKETGVCSGDKLAKKREAASRQTSTAAWPKNVLYLVTTSFITLLPSPVTVQWNVTGSTVRPGTS